MFFLKTLLYGISLGFMVMSFEPMASIEKSVIRFEFTTPKKCNIWVIDAKETDIKFIGVNNPTNKKTDGNIITYTMYSGESAVMAHNVLIEAKNNDIFINNDSIGKSINATIEPDGNVTLNAFYRTFD